MMLRGKLARTMFMAGAMVMSALTIPTAATGAASGQMITGAQTSQPIGHFEFCKRHPRECLVRSANVSPLLFSEDLWNQISSVNTGVNSAIKPMSDLEIYGREELWTYPAGVGDCEDYALEKRRILMGKGFPASTVLMTVVRKPDGEGHAVLTVRTDKGDFVLDNLADEVLPWDQTGYRFLKRQATNHTGRWVSIRGDNTAPLVGAVQATAQ